MKENKIKDTEEVNDSAQELDNTQEVEPTQEVQDLGEQVLSYSEPESEMTSPELLQDENEKPKRKNVWKSFVRWWKKVTAPLVPPLKKIGAWFKRNFGKYISPAFLAMLLMSFVMWYLIKLNYTYRTELPLIVNIEGTEIRVTCVAEADGYNLLSNKYSNKKRNIKLKWSDLEINQSAVTPRAVVISPYSLQNAISVQRPDIKIISMGVIPEVELWSPSEP